MPLDIHPATMFFALVASTIAAMLVLLWAYWLNRGESGLLWTAIAFLATAAATFLLVSRNVVPDLVAIGFGGAGLVLAASLVAIAGRVFARRASQLWLPLPGLAIWALTIATPELSGDRDIRLSILSVICGAYYLLAARNFYIRDGLLTRVPLTVILTCHGLFVLARVPLVLSDSQAGISLTNAGWFGLSMLEAVVFIQVVSFLMVSLTKERLERALTDAALTDQLTGLGNRRAFFDRGEAAVALARRQDAPLSVILFDLDRFKEVNDRYGHPVGDAVIETFARAAQKRLRAGDFVARLGGEEFAAFLPDTGGDHAALVALQVNQAFEVAVGEMKYPGLAGTACAGIASLSGTLPTLQSLLTAADRALYEAKGRGRGQVRLIVVNDVDARAA